MRSSKARCFAVVRRSASACSSWRRPRVRRVWGAAFDRDLQDVLALHRDVAQAIAAQVLVRGARGPTTSGAPRGSVDPETFEAYLKGRYHLNRRRDEDLAESRRVFRARRSVRDPGYAPRVRRPGGLSQRPAAVRVHRSPRRDSAGAKGGGAVDRAR